MLTVWFDGWFSSAFNIMELLKKNEDKEPIKIIATHYKEMGYKVLCDEFFIRNDFKEGIEDREYKEWALNFCRENSVDIFFPRRYFSALYDAHEEFSYISKNNTIKKCHLVVPGVFCKYNSYFTPIFESKLKTNLSLKDWEIDLSKYELPCRKLKNINEIEEFKKYLDSINFEYNKLCIKPISGTGAEGFRILDYPYDAWKTKDILERSNIEYIIMPYLEGKEISIDFLYYNNETITVPRIKDKATRIQKIEMNNETIKLCKDIQASGIPEVLEVVGNVQFIEHRGKFYLLEINTRMSGGIYLDDLAGINFPYLMIKKIQDEVVKVPKIRECQVVNVERGIRVI